MDAGYSIRTPNFGDSVMGMAPETDGTLGTTAAQSPALDLTFLLDGGSETSVNGLALERPFEGTESEDRLGDVRIPGEPGTPTSTATSDDARNQRLAKSAR